MIQVKGYNDSGILDYAFLVRRMKNFDTTDSITRLNRLINTKKLIGLYQSYQISCKFLKDKLYAFQTHSVSPGQYR